MNSPNADNRSGDDDDERERPFPGRLGEPTSDMATVNPLNKTLKGKEQPCAKINTNSNKTHNAKSAQAKKSPGRFREPDMEHVAEPTEAIKKNTPFLPEEEVKQPSVPNNNQGLKTSQGRNRNQCKTTKFAKTKRAQVTGNEEFSNLVATTALQMADLSDSNEDDDSDDSKGDDEQRPGAIPVPGPSGEISSRSFLWTYQDLRSAIDEPMVVESSTTINDNLPIIAELTEDVEERLQRKVEEQVEERVRDRLELEVEERLRNQPVAEAVEVKSSKNKTVWILSFVALLCTIAVILGVTLSNTKNTGSDESNSPNTTIPVTGSTSSNTSTPHNGSTISNTTSASNSPKYTFEELVEWLGPNVTENIDVFDNTTTPQYLAMYWLANDAFDSVDELNSPSATLDEIYLERYVLAVIFYAFQESSLLSSLNFLSSLSVCNWNNPAVCSPSTITDWKCASTYGYGVECNDDLAITAMYLEDAGLIGSIPTEIGLLTLLERIGLGNNQYIAGSLPATIFKLTKLRVLSAYNNQLTGTISSSIGNLSNLEFLNFERTSMSGDIPFEAIGKLTHLGFLQLHLESASKDWFIRGSKEIAKLTNLQYLGLSGVSDVFGTIPSTIHGLSKLTHLDLSNNRFTGSFPVEIFDLSNLEYLHLNYNSLNGTIPELGLLRQLTYLAMSQNSLSGTLLSELGLLNQLRWLDLSGNNFRGVLPSELDQLTQLESLDLRNNSLSGILPSESGLLHKLTYLDLSQNSLSGTLPSELGLLDQLTYLDLWENNFSGMLLSELGLLSNMYYLDLSENKFSGTVPMELGSLVSSQVYLYENNFTGTLDEVFCGSNNTNWVVADCGNRTDQQPELQCSCCDCCSDGIACFGDDNVYFDDYYS